MSGKQETGEPHHLTASIVDISEIEEETANELEREQQRQQQAMYSANNMDDDDHHHHHHHHHDQRQQQQLNNQQPPNPRTITTNSSNRQLYLFHEGLPHDQRTISSLLSSGGHLHLPGGGFSRSADTSPAQTLVRQDGAGSALPALDYRPASAVPANEQQRFLNLTERPQAAPAGHQNGQQQRKQQQQQNSNQKQSIQFEASSTDQQYGSHPQPDSSQKANLGTLTGVYFPCVQNIFGVILFIRMVWIVGTAGVPAAFALVFICCCVTLTTSISLSAIATNGIVPAGGSYFMISRALGPECGGAVGTMFFLGTTVAGAMYITGAVEIMLNYMAPSWGLFGDFQRDVSIMYNNIRVYGTLLLIIVGLLVWIGVKFVSKLAPIALFCVLFSIFSIYAGILINYNGRPDLMLCVVGDRLVTLRNMPFDEPPPTIGHQSDSQPKSTRSGNNTLGLSEQQLYELRKTRALCTFDKLRYIFCPSTPVPTNSELQPNQPEVQQQDSQQSQSPINSQQIQEQLMRERFSRPPNMSNCDAYFRKNQHQIHLEKAVPGIASGVLFKNMKPRFRRKGTLVSYDDGELDWLHGVLSKTQQQQQQQQHHTTLAGELSLDEEGPAGSKGASGSLLGNGYNYVFVDITTTFTVLISIYFPSCTGILAGSNRSGDLADAQRSIPLGTISAQLTTSFVYLSCIVLFGATFNNLFIRDKFGESMGGQLAVTQIAWPEPTFILVGGLLSTLGAALQSLVGAPRILQGIARDDVIPCFGRFAKLSKRGEPEMAIIATLAISWIAVLIGNLDFIAPILTIFLVMCYFFINLACTLHSLLGSPNWRPRFKHYHWSISTLGCLLCLFVMIVSSWIYFVIAILLACCIYRYIQFSGAQKEWGDGKQGLALSAAIYNLLRLKTTEPHTKNWRPQLLLFCKLKPSCELEPPFSKAQMRHRRANNQAEIMGRINELGEPATMADCNHDLMDEQQQPSLAVAHPKLFTFASQLKAGKGLTLVSSVIDGEFQDNVRLAQEARQVLQQQIQAEKVRGFGDVVVASSIRDGLCYQIQSAGLGGLKHNTVVLGWPQHWRKPILPTKPANLLAKQHQRQPHLESRPSRGGASASASASVSVAATACNGTATTNRSAPNEGTKTRAHLFIDLMRNVQASQNALLVVKGIDNWPESCDKLGGFIDIWWIVNDGGLLMLLPHLLKQHRTWKACQLRIFTVAQPDHDPDQMRQSLDKFLYHLRIEAKVDIVVMKDTEISDYAYERTLMMEQRSEIIKRLNTQRKQSILLEQEVDGRLIRFRIRKPSIYELEGGGESGSSVGGQQAGAGGMQLVGTPASPPASSSGSHHSTEHFPMVELQSASSTRDTQGSQTGGECKSPPGADKAEQRQELSWANLRPDEMNVRRMHTALSLNEAILRRSKQAKLVIINLPGAPQDNTPEAENNYMEFIEILTDKLERILLVQNGGREVITIHS